MSPAERLRAAAERARTLHENALPAPWTAYRPGHCTWVEAGDGITDVIGPDDVVCGSHCQGGTSTTTLTPADAAVLVAGRNVLGALADLLDAVAEMSRLWEAAVDSGSDLAPPEMTTAALTVADALGVPE